MGGQPVWLASMSLARNGYTVAASDMLDHERQLAHAVLFELLDGVGDTTRQRLFRMTLTLCLHRAATDREVAKLPAYFDAAQPIDLAGGPVEILWQTEADRPSTRPCEQPGHRVLWPNRPDLWFPTDCGACEPCRARAALSSYVGAEVAIRNEGLIQA